MGSFTRSFKVLHNVPRSHGDRHIGSLFRVDEPVTDDSLTHATPQCMESFCFTNRIFLIVIYRVKEKDTKISLPRKE